MARIPHRFVFSLFVFSLPLAAGCSCSGDDDPLVDAGDPDAPDVETGTISGSQVTTFITSAGQTDVPVDLSSADIEVLAPDGSGGVLALPGVGLADGTFTVDDVPMAPYVLRVGSSYFFTSERTFDLGSVELGRSDATPVQLAADFVLDVDQMDAWVDGDRLELVAADAGANIFGLEFDAVNAPVADDVALTGFTINYLDALFNARDTLIEGDETFITHLSTKTDNLESYLAVTEVFTPATFTMVDGTATNLTGSFTDVVQDLSVAADVRGTSVEALRSSMVIGEEFSTFSPNYFVAISPFGDDAGPLGFVSLADYVAPDNADHTLTMTYGNPFPADWALWESFGGGFLSDVDPGPNTVLGVSISSVSRAAGGFAGAPITLELAPVTAISVDGNNLSASARASGPTPTLSWTAPAMGSPDYYVIRIRQLTGASFELGTVVATLRTTDTSIDMPAGILTVGNQYVVEVTALGDDGSSVEAPFRSSGSANVAARVPSHILTIE